MVVELELLVLLGVGGRLGTANLQVFGRQRRAEGSRQDLVLLERIERLGRRQREAADAAPLALLLGEVARVLVDRLTRVEATLDAIEGGGDQAAEREIRVGAVVARLQLEVRRAFLVVPVPTRDADRGLAVLDPPRRVGRAPVVR